MFREKKESRLLIVLKGGKVEFQATNIDMVELAHHVRSIGAAYGCGSNTQRKKPG